jgi:hypothetical protein
VASFIAFARYGAVWSEVIIVACTFSVEADTVSGAIPKTRLVLALWACCARRAYLLRAIEASGAFLADAGSIHAQTVSRAFVGARVQFLVQCNVVAIWSFEPVFADAFSW